MHLLDGAVRQSLVFNISRRVSQPMRTGSRFPIPPYSVAKSSPTLCNPMDWSMPGFSVTHCLLEFAQTNVHWVSDVIQPSIVCCPFSCPQSFPESLSFPVTQLLASDGLSVGASASLSVLPVNEYSGLIYFRINWFDLLAVQGTLKSLLQYNNSKASILWHSAVFMIQLLHPYLTTGKTIALTIETLSTKWCLCFLIYCLSLSELSFQGATSFNFIATKHSTQGASERPCLDWAPNSTNQWLTLLLWHFFPLFYLIFPAPSAVLRIPFQFNYLQLNAHVRVGFLENANLHSLNMVELNFKSKQSDSSAYILFYSAILPQYNTSLSLKKHWPFLYIN